MHLQRTGLTLIEVVASLAILGGLLATVVVAAARHTRQARYAQDRIAACEAADRMLQSWVVANRGVIPEQAGFVEGHPDWQWRVAGRSVPAIEPFGCHVGVLEIVRESPGQPHRVLTSIEFISNAAATAGGGGT